MATSGKTKKERGASFRESIGHGAASGGKQHGAGGTGDPGISYRVFPKKLLGGYLVKKQAKTMPKGNY